VAEILFGNEKPELRNLFLLVLDEDAGYRKLIISELRNLGVPTAKGAGKPEEAIEVLKNHRVDAIITE
jgi:CheY-like chemotaxis protein